MGAQGPREHEVVLKDGKGNQAEGKAYAKARDKGSDQFCHRQEEWRDEPREVGQDVS